MLSIITAIAIQALSSIGVSASEKPWDDISKQAQDYVLHESPETVWPFEKESWDSLSHKPNKVFAHFFVPFPLSYENKVADEDYYVNYLDPLKSDQVMGSASFYTKGSGGYIRQRPLPVGPWDSPYWKEINYSIQIYRAMAMGIDGFSVDILQTQAGKTQYDRVGLLLETAEHVAPGFPILLMPDAAAAFKKCSVEEAAEALLPLARSPAAYRLEDDRVLIAPFYANARTPEFWEAVMQEQERKGVSTAFMPVFQFFERLDQNAQAFTDISFGMSDWGFRDIGFAESLSFRDGASVVEPYTETWMAPVSPQDFRPKDLIVYEAQNTQLYRYLWDVAMDEGARYVQLITWNDYSEASEIEPSSKTQYLFYDLGAYYTQWFKNGTPPHINEDAIYYCHRENILPVKGLDVGLQRTHFSMSGKTPIQNRVEMVALLTAPATLEIVQGENIQTKDCDAGLATFDVPAQVGQPIFRIWRNDEVVVELVSNWQITDTSSTENPLYCGGSSTRSVSFCTDNP